MSSVRFPSVAGMFYPADPQELRAQVETFLASAESTGATPKALVAPHAGYVYSGPIAASAYTLIRPRAEQIRKVVLLGPTHRVAVRGLVYSSASHFRTPLGDIPVDTGSLAAIADLPQVAESDRPFEGEHCLEVQLPFLQALLPNFSIVPLLVGLAEAEEVAEVLQRLWGDDETLIVISSDLSHYHPYEQARTLDTATSQAIERLDLESLSGEMACGSYPLKGLLLEARRRHMQADVLDLRNSGDTAGPRNQVVGYGAYGFH